MSHLVAVMFNSSDEALKVRRILAREDTRRPVKPADAAVVYRDGKDRIRVSRATGHKGIGFVVGGLVGTLFGLMLPLPVDGATIPIFVGVCGAGIGALGAGMLDKAIERDIPEQIGGGIEEGKAALLLFVHPDKIDVVLNDLSGHPGQVLRTSLSPEWEEKLRVVMNHGNAPVFTNMKGPDNPTERL